MEQEQKRLSEIVAEHFEKRLDEYFEKEKVDDNLFPPENYNSCFDRAMDWIQRSFDDTRDAMATDAGYAIAIDREVHAKENTMEEQDKLLKAGANPDVSQMSFWMG